MAALGSLQSGRVTVQSRWHPAYDATFTKGTSSARGFQRARHTTCPCLLTNHPANEDHGGSARGLLAAACLLAVACNGDSGGPTGPSLGTTSSVSVRYPADHGTVYIGAQVQFRTSDTQPLSITRCDRSLLELSCSSLLFSIRCR